MSNLFVWIYSDEKGVEFIKYFMGGGGERKL
jgi:hypothetical protein